MKTKHIALISDFGMNDPFVGAIKGVILSRAPGTQIIDITHQIPPQDIRTASFYLMSSMGYMPKGTLFLVVVDPHVGTGRGIIWARTANYQFICPDNGIISWVEEKEPITGSRFINNSNLFLPKISSTFHGRDIMAPVAAAVAKGLPEKQLGPVFKDYRRFPLPAPERAGTRVNGQVIAIDNFGNAITNIRQQQINARSIFTVSGRVLKGLKLTYASVPEGDPLALIGSFGYLEFSVRNGSFARTFNVKIGDKVEAIVSIDEQI
ncbi:MAG: SAM-dependent chlorinase/fluorinase [Elusimicrobiales bacterium]|nr:SAM-dependent chlorinase/fluorinase [Elusimicrobiales bacterium]